MLFLQNTNAGTEIAITARRSIESSRKRCRS